MKPLARNKLYTLPPGCEPAYVVDFDYYLPFIGHVTSMTVIITDFYGIIGFYYQEKLSKQRDSSDQFAFLLVFYPCTVVLNKVFCLLCFSSFAFA